MNTSRLNNTILCVLLFVITNACVPSNKPLKKDSAGELDKIINELKLERFNYGFAKRNKNGKNEEYFKVDLGDIDDSTNFVPYTHRIIKLFNDSDYQLNKVDFVCFYFTKNEVMADIYVFYKIDPRTLNVIEESND